MPQAETIEAKTYYSKNGGLTFWIKRPTRVLDEVGRSIPDEGPMVQFMPQADGYGRFTTSDPELIAACDKRMAEVKDIFEPAEYIRQITPLEKQLDAKERKIESQNRLLADMQKKLDELTRQQSGGQRPSQAQR